MIKISGRLNIKSADGEGPFSNRVAVSRGMGVTKSEIEWNWRPVEVIKRYACAFDTKFEIDENWVIEIFISEKTSLPSSY